MDSDGVSDPLTLNATIARERMDSEKMKYGIPSVPTLRDDNEGQTDYFTEKWSLIFNLTIHPPKKQGQSAMFLVRKVACQPIFKLLAKKHAEKHSSTAALQLLVACLSIKNQRNKTA